MRRFLLAVLIFGGGLLGCAFRPAASSTRTYYPISAYSVGYAPTVVELKVEVPQP